METLGNFFSNIWSHCFAKPITWTVWRISYIRLVSAYFDLFGFWWRKINFFIPRQMLVPYTFLLILFSHCFKVFFKKGPYPVFFSLFSSFQYTVDNNQMFNININFCWWLDSNHWPLVLEATALPTELQPLPQDTLFKV